MKAQDQFSFDETILGLDNIYFPVGDDSYFVNCPNILSTNKVITIGKKYILLFNPKGTGVVMTDVIFLDAYYFEGVIYLIVQEITSQITSTIDLNIEYPEKPNKWLLIDSNYFFDEMNAMAIKSYCSGNCDDSDKKSKTECKPCQSHDDDLLDFEF